MNSQLENAIQEAMAELDKMTEKQKQDTEKKDVVESNVIVEKHVPVQRPSLRTKGHSNASKQRHPQGETQNTIASKPSMVDTTPEVSIPSSNLRSSSSAPAHSIRLRRSNR